MPASPLDKILPSNRLGFVAEHGSKKRPIMQTRSQNEGESMNEKTETELSGSLIEHRMRQEQQTRNLSRASAQNTELMLDVIKDFIIPDRMHDAREALRRAMWESKRSFFSQEEISKMAMDAIATARDINSLREPS